MSVKPVRRAVLPLPAAPAPHPGRPQLLPVPGGDAGSPAAALWLAVHLPACTQPALRQLALGALRFTPRVSLEPPDGLLLEVRGSLHLFGGLAGLRAALCALAAEAGLTAQCACAPTPLAALAAARAGREVTIAARAQLTGLLAPLPLAVLRWPPQVVERLKAAGVRTLGEVLRLPRAGFARRFGTAQLAQLDRLSGRLADLRQDVRPPERFRRRCELSAEAESCEALQLALQGLLAELGDFLRVRQAGVMAVQCRLLHRRGAATRCELRLAAPGHDARHLGALFAEELSRCLLPQPVRALELRAGRLFTLADGAGSLWQPGEHGGMPGSEAHTLIERLRARLGDAAIHGLTLHADHRPELAWRLSAPPAPGAAPRAATATAACIGQRPLWLLDPPEPLAVRAGLPRRRGALTLLGEPERIESGWWDGAEVARDYYTARDAHGVRLWVFRERQAPHGWFLHGIFG